MKTHYWIGDMDGNWIPSGGTVYTNEGVAELFAKDYFDSIGISGAVRDPNSDWTFISNYPEGDKFFIPIVVYETVSGFLTTISGYVGNMVKFEYASVVPSYSPYIKHIEYTRGYGSWNSTYVSGE